MNSKTTPMLERYNSVLLCLDLGKSLVRTLKIKQTLCNIKQCNHKFVFSKIFHEKVLKGTLLFKHFQKQAYILSIKLSFLPKDEQQCLQNILQCIRVVFSIQKQKPKTTFTGIIEKNYRPREFARLFFLNNNILPKDASVLSSFTTKFFVQSSEFSDCNCYVTKIYHHTFYFQNNFIFLNL